MSWLGDVPWHIPGVPNLTWAAWIWFVCLIVAGGGFAKLLGQSWNAYWQARITAGAEAEQLLAKGMLLQQADSILIIVAGLVVGVVGVTEPHREFSRTPQDMVALLALLAIPLLKLLQALVTVRIHAAALRRLALRERTPQ